MVHLFLSISILSHSIWLKAKRARKFCSTYTHSSTQGKESWCKNESFSLELHGTCFILKSKKLLKNFKLYFIQEKSRENRFLREYQWLDRAEAHPPWLLKMLSWPELLGRGFWCSSSSSSWLLLLLLLLLLFIFTPPFSFPCSCCCCFVRPMSSGVSMTVPSCTVRCNYFHISVTFHPLMYAFGP